MSRESQSSAVPYREVGRYRVYAELAAGGMATVHLGCLIGPGGFSKLVAVKCLHKDLANEPDFVSMFLDEARLASSIHHPNVVSSLDLVAEDGELLVIMDYVHGETLSGLLRTAKQKALPPPVPVAIRIVCDALEGLHAAHTASLAGRQLSIVHRDVSPQNIMVGVDGNTRVLDFGIAKAALRARLTAAGTVKGKLAYMAPEQVKGRAVDARTDVFAAGVVLWEALTGQRLFWAPDAKATARRVLRGAIEAPSSFHPGLPPELDEVVLKALSRNPVARHATAQELAQALRAAAPEGSRSDVSSWVANVAQEVLAQRLRLLQELEASALGAPPLAFGAPAAAARARPEATLTKRLSEGTQVHATITTIRPGTRPPRGRRLVPWAAAVLGLLGAFGVIIGTKQHALVGRFWGAGSPAAAGQLARVEASLPSDSASNGRASDELAVSPTTLHEAPAVAATTLHEAPAVAATALPLATDEDAAEQQELPKKRASPRSAPHASASAAPAVSAPSASSASSAPSAPSAPSAEGTPRTLAPSCNPPFRIDASGVRRIKPECL
jgi:eukaryotic-like serine/threonine-protein kinase